MVDLMSDEYVKGSTSVASLEGEVLEIDEDKAMHSGNSRRVSWRREEAHIYAGSAMVRGM